MTPVELRDRSYYAHKARPVSKRSISDEAHTVEIMRVFNGNYRCYGAYRIHRHLNREGHRIARCSVERLMPALGIHGVIRGGRPTRPSRSTSNMHLTRRGFVMGGGRQRDA